MAKITVGDVVMEGTIEELREWAKLSGVEFPEAKKAEGPLKVGDYVKVVNDRNVHGEERPTVSVGDIRLLSEIDYGGFPYNAERLDGSDYDFFRKDALVRATDEEVAEAKAKLDQKFNVGDYAKTLTKSKHGSVGDGEIIVITNTDYYGEIVGELLLDTEYEGIYMASQLVKATDEEVKFAKIGRKPKELKEGDLVKYRNRSFAEVTRVGNYAISVKMPNGSIVPVNFETVTLVAPAEARFDA